MRAMDAVRTWKNDVVAGWNRFWFTPVDPATLGLIRICAGSMLFYTHLVWSLDLSAFFGPDSWLPPDAVRLMQRESYNWSYLWYLNSPFTLWAAHIAGLIVFALFTVGFYTRITSVLAALITLSYFGRATGALFGLDQINVVLALYLAVGPCGDAFSLDRRLAQRKAGVPLPVRYSWTANVAIRLIQLHMCVIYLFAGTAKLTGPAWWNGTALWMAIGNYEYQSMDMTWMAHWPMLINLMTHVTVYWEVFYIALIWPRVTRPIMLALAVPLHMGIALCLGMVTFGLVMLFGNLAFVPPAFVRACLPSAWRQPSRAGESRVAPPNGPSKGQRAQARATGAR